MERGVDAANELAAGSPRRTIGRAVAPLEAFTWAHGERDSRRQIAFARRQTRTDTDPCRRTATKSAPVADYVAVRTGRRSVRFVRLRSIGVLRTIFGSSRGRRSRYRRTAMRRVRLARRGLVGLVGRVQDHDEDHNLRRYPRRATFRGSRRMRLAPTNRLRTPTNAHRRRTHAAAQRLRPHQSLTTSLCGRDVVRCGL